MPDPTEADPRPSEPDADGGSAAPRPATGGRRVRRRRVASARLRHGNRASRRMAWAETITARNWLARAGVLLVAIVILRLAFELWWVGRIHEHAWTQVAVAIMYFLGALFLFLAAANIRHERLDVLGFLVLCGCLAVYSAAQMLVFARHYTSDALLFVHESALLTLNGLNPYQHDLVGGYEAFQVPYYVSTPTTSGGIITNLNYPALSFLVYTPFVALGLQDLRPVSAAFLVATLGLVFLAAPRHLRLLTLGFLFLSSFFLSFALSGFDILYVFFLLAAVVTWRRHPMLSMVAFGLSAAVKQPVWFIAPFLLIRLWKEAPAGAARGNTEPGDEPSAADRAWHMAKGTSFCIAAFLVPNAWFIVWHPWAWMRGVLTPLGATSESLVPLSQGSTIGFYTGWLYAPPYLLPMLALSILVLLLCVFAKYYERMSQVLWIAPALILTVNERALQNYFEMFYPIALALLLAKMPSIWDFELWPSSDAIALERERGRPARQPFDPKPTADPP